MFKNSLGGTTNPSESIFPIITYNPELGIWTCLGTGFFIDNYELFVTAKHVFINNGIHEKTLYGVQSTASGERHLRPVKRFSPNENADIGVGILGPRRLDDGSNVSAEIATTFQIDNRPLEVGDIIRTFAFPLSKVENLDDEGTVEFSFEGQWSNGQTSEIHENGCGLLKNKCYQTTMEIKGGASGGPVLRNNLVVGINSTGYEFDEEGQEPLSFITPIELINGLQIKTRQGNSIIEIN